MPDDLPDIHTENRPYRHGFAIRRSARVKIAAVTRPHDLDFTILRGLDQIFVNGSRAGHFSSTMYLKIVWLCACVKLIDVFDSADHDALQVPLHMLQNVATRTEATSRDMIIVECNTISLQLQVDGTWKASRHCDLCHFVSFL